LIIVLRSDTISSFEKSLQIALSAASLSSVVECTNAAMNDSLAKPVALARLIICNTQVVVDHNYNHENSILKLGISNVKFSLIKENDD
jgi:hypothetical protein